MDIGDRLKNARKKAKYTQEQIAEYLNVSRQTISNWENNKTYPDIVSVIKLSNLYHVSLDYLLKGENDMEKYLNYLEESTNTVKSKRKLAQLILMLTHLIIWVTAIVAFWCFTKPDEAMGYAILYIWIVMPVTMFVVSLIFGRNNYWGRKKWLYSIYMGVMYMLLGYITFDLANIIETHKILMPDWEMLLIGIGISLVGMGIGYGDYKLQSRKERD